MEVQNGTFASNATGVLNYTYNYGEYGEGNGTDAGDDYDDDYYYDYMHPDSDKITRVWFYLIGVFGIPVCITGMTCNLLSLGVLLSKEMRAPPTYFLIWLAIYDFFYLLANGVVVCFENFYTGVTGNDHVYYGYYTPIMPFSNAVQAVTLTGSVYTTIALSLNRVIAVAAPLKWPTLCTTIRVKIILVLVFIFSIFLDIPLMMEFTHDTDVDYDTNETFVVVAETDYSKSVFHTKVYLLGINVIMGSILPTLVIVAANVFLLTTLKKQRKRTNSMTGRADAKGKKSSQREANLITGQVIFISAFTVMARTLEMVTFIIMESYGTSTVNECPLYCGTLAALAHFSNMLNATVNFFSYCLFGTKFRKCFLEVYGCKKCCPSVLSRKESSGQHSHGTLSTEDALGDSRKTTNGAGPASTSEGTKNSQQGEQIAMKNF